jgi:hypothetical protein
VQAKFAASGTTPFPKEQRTVAAHVKLFATDYERINRLIDAANVKPE